MTPNTQISVYQLSAERGINFLISNRVSPFKLVPPFTHKVAKVLINNKSSGRERAKDKKPIQEHI